MTFFPQIHNHPLPVPTNLRGAQKWTFLFAVGNIVLTGLFTTCLLVLILIIYADIAGLSGKRSHDELADALVVGLFSFLVIVAGGAIIAFIFACILLNGVLKKKHEYIKAYFIYGVVVNTISLSSTLYWAVLTEGSDLNTLATILLIIVVYSFVLSMIRVTYKSYEQAETLMVANPEAPPEKI